MTVDPRSTCVDNFATTEIMRCTQTWTIAHFSGYCGDSYCGQYPKLLSNKFTLPNNYRNLYFNLDLRPRGDSDSNSDYVSLFLCSEGKGERTIMCAMSVIDANGQKRFTKRSLRKDVNDNADYGYYRFISHKELKDPKNSLLVNDELKIHVEVNVLVSEVRADLDLKKTAVCEKKRTIEMLGSMLDSGKYTDVKFCFGNRKSLAAHKIFLSMRSPVFAAMFENDFKEKKENRVEIKEVTYDTFNLLLRYCYTGAVEQAAMEKLGDKLFVAADMYQIDSLKAYCEQALCIQVQTKPKLAKTLLRLANLHGAEKLRAKALEVIKCNNLKRMREVLDNPEQVLEIDEILDDLTKKSKPSPSASATTNPVKKRKNVSKIRKDR